MTTIECGKIKGVYMGNPYPVNDYDAGNDECFKDLANAIVIQAVDDYRKAIRDKFTSKSGGDINKKMKRDCLKFFKSGYFQLLTNIHGEDIIKFLDKEKEDEDAKNKACVKVN